MIYPIMSNSAGSNSYIISGKKAAIIDAGIDPREILKKIGDLNIGIDVLINTHCHYDHIAGNSEIKKRTHASLAIHELDAVPLEENNGELILSDWFYAKLPRIEADIKLRDNQLIDLGTLKLKVIHTPGHTPGSICLYERKSKSLFSGDTIFNDSIGRTDLPGSDYEKLKKSVERLIELDKKDGIDIIYPGHGKSEHGRNLKNIYEKYFG